jgi:hypothetical protein
MSKKKFSLVMTTLNHRKKKKRGGEENLRVYLRIPYGVSSNRQIQQ